MLYLHMRKITLFFIAFFLVFSSCEMAYAFAKGDQECSKCHTLSSEQAKKALSGIIPDIKVLDIKSSAASGLWEIVAETGGKKVIVYLDYAGKNLIAGNLFSLQSRTNLTQERLQEINKIDVSQIPLNDALVMGENDAKYKVIVFDDPD
jgi:thiol:disulfide interchange protein DsbC